MKILVLNSGSSSIKYRLFDSDNDFHVLKQGMAEKIGPNPELALQALFSDELLQGVEAVGHRIVHGGEQFKSPVRVDSQVIKEIAELAKWAPLHSEVNLAGIKFLQEQLPYIPHIAVFDTSTHATMGYKAFLYGIPLEYYEKYKIRKYGFHGINHSYMAHEAARLIKKRVEELKIVTCHLGNGCSISAFEKGKSIDNSMGFTPLEGLVMGTRCGDLDPSIVLYLFEKFGGQSDKVKDLLNKKSGLFGLCGKNDMRNIIELAKKGVKSAQIAIDVFVYRVQKYIGAYVAALNGADAIVFSGGIGENSSSIRALIMKNFSYLGASIDFESNERNEAIFSTPDSLLFLMNIPANEEVEIAKQTYQVVSKDG